MARSLEQEDVLLPGSEGSRVLDHHRQARDGPDGRTAQLVRQRLCLGALAASKADVSTIANSGAWEKASFKKYNFEAEGAPTFGGALHPLMKVREEFRNIFFETGYAISPTRITGFSTLTGAWGWAGSPRCRPTALSNLRSGASTLFTFRNNTRHEKCKTLSTSRVNRSCAQPNPLLDMVANTIFRPRRTGDG